MAEQARTAERAEAARQAKRAQQAEITAGVAGFRERYEAHRREKEAQEKAARAREEAHKVVSVWERLIKDYGAALPTMLTDPTLNGTRERLIQFASLLRHEGFAAGSYLLRTEPAAFGMENRRNLALALDASQPERFVTAMLDSAEANKRAELKREAERKAELERQAAELREQQRPRRRPSSSPGMSPF